MTSSKGHLKRNARHQVTIPPFWYEVLDLPVLWKKCTLVGSPKSSSEICSPYFHCSTTQGISQSISKAAQWGSACRETLCATLNPSWRPLLHSTVALPVLQGQRNLTPRYSHFQEHKLTLKAEEKFQSLEQQFYFPCHSCSLSEQNSGSSHNLFIVPCCARLLLHLL